MCLSEGGKAHRGQRAGSRRLGGHGRNLVPPNPKSKGKTPEEGDRIRSAV